LLIDSPNGRYLYLQPLLSLPPGSPRLFLTDSSVNMVCPTQSFPIEVQNSPPNCGDTLCRDSVSTYDSPPLSTLKLTVKPNESTKYLNSTFTSYNQDDWSTLLPQASLAYNNSIHSATKFTPFYSNFGYHPRWVNELVSTNTTEIPEGARIAESIIAIHEQCTNNIAEVNKLYAQSYDKKRLIHPPYRKGDQVMLSMENIRTLRPMKKLDLRQSGPFTVLDEIGSHAYRIQLPATMKVHNVFHASLLRPYTPPSYPGQATEPPPPIETADNVLEYKVAAIIDSRNNPRSGRLEYLVEWLGYEGTDEHAGWEPKEHLEGSDELILNFHATYPNKPSSSMTKSRRKGRKRV
jgi:hypothetical protein